MKVKPMPRAMDIELKILDKFKNFIDAHGEAVAIDEFQHSDL